MRTIYILVILVLLALAAPAAPAHAGGVVTVCDEAHLLAALAGGGTVTFACSGTITLTAEIVISADTTIDGSGQDVTISGNNAVRVFWVNEGVTLNLNRLTVADGAGSGYPGGGGIFNSGTLTVHNSTFSGNSASWGGGGIFNYYGTMAVSNSTFFDNSSGPEYAGGYGGGIYNGSGTLIVNNSTFSGNSCSREGGGIDNAQGAVTVNNTTFSGNDANWSGGGIYNDSGTNGMLTVSNCTFAGNSSNQRGGGISASGDTVTVSNSTFFGNSADYEGGGISYDGALTVTNCTFFGNGATNGGGIWNYSGTTTLKNTIIANSPSGNNCVGTITDGGGNLSYPDTTCPGINADPMLDPLQNNGGPTETMALGEGSAAIDAADDAICAAPPVNNLDQRGVTRPQGLHCDIGAVEQIIEPAAVSLSTINAEGESGAIPPIIVFGLLLVALASSGAFRCVRQMRCD